MKIILFFLNAYSKGVFYIKAKTERLDNVSEFTLSRVRPNGLSEFERSSIKLFVEDYLDSLFNRYNTRFLQSQID